jgi:hypothetical protein
MPVQEGNRTLAGGSGALGIVAAALIAIEAVT